MKNLLKKFPFTIIRKETLDTLKRRNARLENHCHILSVDPFGSQEERRQQEIKTHHMLGALNIRHNEKVLNPFCRYPYQNTTNVGAGIGQVFTVDKSSLSARPIKKVKPVAS